MQIVKRTTDPISEAPKNSNVTRPFFNCQSGLNTLFNTTESRETVDPGNETWLMRCIPPDTYYLKFEDETSPVVFSVCVDHHTCYATMRQEDGSWMRFPVRWSIDWERGESTTEEP